MKLNLMRCKECRQEMTPSRIDSLAGEDSNVRIRIENMPAMACANGHKRFIAPEFAVELMQALFKGEALVTQERAVLKGLLRKRLVCPGCSTDLKTNETDSAEVKRVLDLGQGNPVGVTVVLPKFNCASCGKESVPPDTSLGDAFMKASAQAFRSASVTPI